MLFQNNHGILSLLDEESSKLNVSDEMFLSRVTALCSSQSHSLPERRNRHYVTTPATSDNSLPPNCFRYILPLSLLMVFKFLVCKCKQKDFMHT